MSGRNWYGRVAVSISTRRDYFDEVRGRADYGRYGYVGIERCQFTTISFGKGG